MGPSPTTAAGTVPTAVRSASGGPGKDLSALIVRFNPDATTIRDTAESAEPIRVSPKTEDSSLDFGPVSRIIVATKVRPHGRILARP